MSIAIAAGRWTSVLGVCLWFVAAVCLAQTAKADSAWVEVPAPGATSARAFVQVDNPTAYATYLLSAVSDAARTIEFRDGAKGDALVKEATVDAYGALTMSPSGVHMRLVDITRPLAADDVIVITLTTELGVKMVVKAPVRQKPPDGGEIGSP